VHTDPEAGRLARSYQAEAISYGSHIFLAPGRYRPEGETGLRLLTHEAVHATAQSRASDPLGVIRVSNDHDPAEHQATRIAGGRPGSPAFRARVAPHSVRMVQRQPTDAAALDEEPAGADPDRDSLGPFWDAVITAAVQQVVSVGPMTPLLVAAAQGFIGELTRQWSTKDGIKESLKDLQNHKAEFLVGYATGAWTGFLSPVTDLLQLPVLLYHLGRFGTDLASHAWANSHGLDKDWEKVVSAFKDAYEAIRRDIKAVLIAALSGDPAAAKREAAHQGRKAARQLVRDVAGKEAKQSDTTPAAGLVDRAKSLFAAESHWGSIGNTSGKVVGTLLANALLLAASAGVGNVISEVGAAVAKIGGLLGRLGEGIAAFGALLTRLEALIGAAVGKLASVVPGLKPLLTHLTAAFEQLGAFLRKLAGVVEAEAPHLAAAATTKAAGAAERSLAPGGPKPAPHAPAAAEPKPAPHAPAAAEPKPTPHAPAAAEPKPTPHAPAAAEKAAPKKAAVKKAAATTAARKKAAPKKAAPEPAPRTAATEARPAERTPAEDARPPEGRPSRGIDAELQARASARLDTAQRDLAENAIAIARAKSGAARGRAALADLHAARPPTPDSLRPTLERLERIPDLETRIEALEELGRSAGLGDPEKAFLNWRSKTLRLRHEIQEAAEEAAALQRHQENLQTRATAAAEDLRRSSRRLLDIVRGNGPNYAARSRVTVDEVMTARNWTELPAPRPALQTDHIVAVDRIARMPELDEVLKVYAAGSPGVRAEIEARLAELGDLPQNLTRMRGDANNFKSNASWHDLTYGEMQKFGYTPEMIDRMRRLEDATLQDIRSRIGDLTREFAPAAARPGATPVTAPAAAAAAEPLPTGIEPGANVRVATQPDPIGTTPEPTLPTGVGPGTNVRVATEPPELLDDEVEQLEQKAMQLRLK
jgi:chemotaxis protein histidine kinase CheA